MRDRGRDGAGSPGGVWGACVGSEGVRGASGASSPPLSTSHAALVSWLPGLEGGRWG